MRFLLVLILLIAGCQKATPKTKTAVPLDQVPPVIMKAAQARLPHVTFESVIRKADGVYEVRGKTKNGKVQEVEVTEAGEVLVVE